MTTFRLAGIGALGLLLAACGGAPAPAPSTSAPQTSVTPTSATARSLATALGKDEVAKLDAIGSVLASCVPDLPRCYFSVAVLQSGIAEAQAKIKADPDVSRFAAALGKLDETGRRAAILQGCEEWFTSNGAAGSGKNAGCSDAFDDVLALFTQFEAMI